MTRRVAAVLLLVQILFGLACNDGEPPDPSVRTVDDSRVERPTERCIVEGQTFTWRIHAASETLRCTCEYTSSPPKWSCDQQSVCTSNYDLGANNPSECTVITPPHGEGVSEATVAYPEHAKCEAIPRIVSEEGGIIEITTTCPVGSAGNQSIMIYFTAESDRRMATLSITVSPPGECPSE